MTIPSIHPLMNAGISYQDSMALRRISMTLHRWHEMECGDGNDYGSWSVVRGHKSQDGFEYDDNGLPFVEYHSHSGNKARYTFTPDRERGAQKRLAKIMARYPGMTAYVQTDPRGASLYILPPGVTGKNYNLGIAVYR